MTRIKGAKLMVANFELENAKPLDARTIVPVKIDLQGLLYSYTGLLVTVIADSFPGNNGVYLCTAPYDLFNPTTTPVFVKVLDPAGADMSQYVLKEEGKGLSTNDYTTEEKNKLAGINNQYRGTYTSLLSLKITIPIAAPGDNAIVDDGITRVEYIWDQTTNEWILGTSTPITTDQNIIEGSINPVAGGAVFNALADKVDKIPGKSLVNDTDILNFHAPHSDDQDLSGLVEKEFGKGLSTNDYTTIEKEKLAALTEHYKGTFISYELLVEEDIQGIAGDFAYVDAGLNSKVIMYIWDATDSEWTLNSGASTYTESYIAPAEPDPGNRWLNLNDSILYTWFGDTDGTGAWVHWNIPVVTSASGGGHVISNEYTTFAQQPELQFIDALVTNEVGKTIVDLSNKANKGIATITTNGEMSAADKAKLDGIANNANNYVHPSSHPASIIAQDSENQFVTSSQKTTWNNKQAALGFTPENISNRGVSNGYASLGADTRLPISEAPTLVLKLAGDWSALTNTPTLTYNEPLKIGNLYRVTSSGVQFGLSFNANDLLLYNNGGYVIKIDNYTLTDSELLAKILVVDGHNSGLDADLLDGMHRPAGHGQYTVGINEAIVNNDVLKTLITVGSSGFFLNATNTPSSGIYWSITCFASGDNGTLSAGSLRRKFIASSMDVGNLYIGFINSSTPTVITWTKIITNTDLATATNSWNKVAQIGSDGVMEIGKYIDFHSANGVGDNTDRFESLGGTVNLNGQKIWTAGNMGSSSGLNADLLDGYHASAFVLSTGNAASATKLQTAKTISITGDLTYSVTFDGSANVTGVGTLQNTGVAAAAYGSSTQIPRITVDGKGRITNVITNPVYVPNEIPAVSSGESVVTKTSTGVVNVNTPIKPMYLSSSTAIDLYTSLSSINAIPEYAAAEPGQKFLSTSYTYEKISNTAWRRYISTNII